jgi:Spx/MgsR family transcriptional regulator
LAEFKQEDEIIKLPCDQRHIFHSICIQEWLKKNNSIFIFHNYKQQGISKEKLLEWDAKVGWDSFFNKRSTSWRALPKEEQDTIKNLSAAIKIMQENNSIIKRPIIEYKNGLIIGFNEIDYKRAFL